MLDRLVSRLIFCDGFTDVSLSHDRKTSLDENSPSQIPIKSVLDFWIPYEERTISSLLEEFEYMLEVARLLDLTNRPILEFVNSVLIYTYRFSQNNNGYEKCVEKLVRDAYMECVKLPKVEGLQHKIATNLSQFVMPRPNATGMPICDSDEAIALANSYFKSRGITKPDLNAKIEQIEMLEGKILVSDLQALDRIPLLCDRYIDTPTTDLKFTDRSRMKDDSEIKNNWQDRNEFIAYIKSTNANVIKVIRCAISLAPIHCVWLFTSGNLDFGAIKTSKSAFQPILDMIPLGKGVDSFTWERFSTMKDKIQLLYPLERLPEYTRDNYVDSYFKTLPQIDRVDSTNYSPLKIKITGQDGFNFTTSELKITNNRIDREMINYPSLEDSKYELSKVCGVVTLKTDSGVNEIIIDRNLYPAITPRFTITICTNKGVEMGDLLVKCAEYGIKNLIFIVENCDLAIKVAKSLCIDLDKRAQISTAPWYNKYFGIHIHIVNLDSNSSIEEFHEFLDQRTLVY